MLVGTGLATEIVPLLRQGHLQFTAWNIVRDLPPQGQVPLVVAVITAYVSCLVALRTLKERRPSARDDKNAVATLEHIHNQLAIFVGMPVKGVVLAASSIRSHIPRDSSAEGRRLQSRR